MLTIFINYETDVSILDDFDFYEDRQKAMQERKARQQSSMVSNNGLVGGSEHKAFANNTDDFIKQMSKSFAVVVSLDENNNQVIAANRDNLASNGPIGNVPDDGISVTTQTS